MLPDETIDVVFIHGIISSGAVWDQFISLLETDGDLPFIKEHRFQYDSQKMNWRPDECITAIGTAADQLHTYLANSLPDARSIVLVTHSQGGLVAQRYLARVLGRGGGHELARIKHIAMYACPNNGSQFLLPLRTWAGRIWRHPQERELRPLNEEIIETQRAVMRDVVYAHGCTTNKCHIPVSVYGGARDRIVSAHVAASVFPLPEVVEGNHSTIIKPTNHEALSYTVLKQRLLEVRRGMLSPAAGSDEALAERQLRVSVDPPFGSHDGHVQGREELIRDITSDRDRRVHVLTGMGGSGKTRVAVEIARRSARRVWWVSVIRINGSMQEVASQLGIPESQIDHAWKGAGSPTDLVWRYLQERTEPWLLVFDNADDPRELAPHSGDVSDGTGWLRAPDSDFGMVLVTSRDNRATWGTWCRVHSVTPLGTEDGAAMLREIVGPEGGSFEQARALSDALGGLPLALRAAGLYVNTVRGTSQVWTGEVPITDLGGYLAAVRERFSSIPGGVRKLTETLGMEIVRDVFNLSLELLARRGLPEAAPLLKLFACLNIARIPYYMLLTDEVLAVSGLLAQCTADRRLMVLQGLAGLGLVDLGVMDGIADPDLAHVLSLHPVVHGIFRDDHDVRVQRAEYYLLNARMLLAATERHASDNPEAWEVWSVLVPHAVEVARVLHPGEPRLTDTRVIRDVLELTRRTIRYLIVVGLVEIAEELQQFLLDTAEELLLPIIGNCEALGFDPDDREILALRYEKGRLSIERGNLLAAEAELEQVVAARTHVLGDQHPDTLASRHKLAKAILQQGRLETAERQLASIVEDEKDVRGYDHPDTLVVRHSLARAIFRQNRFAEGEEMLREILAKRYEVWSPTTPETLSVRNSLAYCLIKQYQWDEAEGVARDALRDVGDRQDSARCMELRYTLSLALLYQGEIAEARSVLVKLAADRNRVLGPEHPETKRTRWLLEQANQLGGSAEQG